ncbi:SAM-dependent DNA methyltransferase [Mesorhizobium sp. B3-1-6]|uniref:N-6 DNA methylase n=1 Tax=Mesorhizobium sp. B3-1-6 TaxID=2589895 RepID=UPI00112BDC24|nr:N-6 DNA methylase [Mesorhizobium sp. B3-1-6]TPI34205.1 SAM-dependent DNA methyltransferase [Mesorhizobium sp. B3-1-6]
MNLIDIIERESVKLGYRDETLRRNYAFSNIWGEGDTTCSVPLAAFTQTPPSYRSAAFAVIEATPEAASEVIHGYRALGAPVFLAIEPEQISAWQVYANKPPHKFAEFEFDAIPHFFAGRRESWAPDRIHRAKSIGHIEPKAQLDFVDLGLMPAIAGEIHVKLDRLIREAVADTREFNGDDAIRIFFRGVFRLLAAKILMDRQHVRAKNWNADDVRSVLNAMDDFYDLGNVSQAWPPSAIAALAPVWAIFRSGFNVANISADDLAYVYESTLVTDKARAEFGTHSTPRHVADYIVGRLRLWEFGITPPRVVEPFTGAGVFLGSALRFMRDSLPADWHDKRRHDLLVKHIGGAEIDPFAAEVAKLSLILADYPNANGWKIDEADLFKVDVLRKCLDGARVVLCNPPFEAFTKEEAQAYPEAVKISRSKAVYALEMTLRAEPDMLGFVLPNTVLVDRRYQSQRVALERLYREVELVALPDGIFNVSQANSALVIARKALTRSDQIVRSAVVFDGDKKAFAATGLPSLERERSQPLADTPSGKLWVYPSQELWDRFHNLPKLGSVVKGSWGLRWHSGQRARTSDLPGLDRELGYQDSTSVHQYLLENARWMDVRPAQILAGGNLAWDEPKILCNATRLSRGYWRLAAAVDRLGRRATQQFLGLWPRTGVKVDLDALAAVINGPVINAFLTEHSFDKRFRIGKLEEAPIPAKLPSKLGELSRAYAADAARGSDPEKLADKLAAIDALVLDAYGLVGADRAALLSRMGDDRPVIGRTSRRRRIKHERDGHDHTLGLFTSENIEHDEGEGLGPIVSRAIGEHRLEEATVSIPLSEWAGEVFDAATLEGRLALSPNELERWVAEGMVIVLRGNLGDLVYPLEQFTKGKPTPGMRSVVESVGKPNVAWLWLRTPRPATDEPAPIALLKAGAIDRVLDLAKRDFG